MKHLDSQRYLLTDTKSTWKKDDCFTRVSDEVIGVFVEDCSQVGKSQNNEKGNGRYDKTSERTIEKYL